MSTNSNVDDEEEMADLFSFGSSDLPAGEGVEGMLTPTPTPTPTTAGASGSGPEAEVGGGSNNKNNTSNPSLFNGDASFESASGPAVAGSNDGPDGGMRLLRKDSSDSFMELLNEGGGGVADGSASAGSSGGVGVLVNSTMVGNDDEDEDEILGSMTMGCLSPERSRNEAGYDKETQEMLDWLNEDTGKGRVNSGGSSAAHAVEDQEEVIFVSDDEGSPTRKSLLSPPRLISNNKSSLASSTSTQQKDNDPAKRSPPTPRPTMVSLPPVFHSLEAALNSTDATLSQVRNLAQKTPLEKLADLRPDLYCRLICGNKTAQQTRTSNLADSFQAWQIPKTIKAFWIPKAARFCMESFSLSDYCSENDLIKLLAYHNSNSPTRDNESMDFLVPCVASVILAAGIPVAAASVVLGQVQAHFMPLTAFAKDEQREASTSLHHALYLLAAYHLPLLVVHLDRYLPGWFGPKKTRDSADSSSDDNETREAIDASATQRARRWEQQGQIPPSWLLSFLSGQVYEQNLPMKHILRLWDAQLTHVHCQSLRFFLTLAVLERVADYLILVTGQDLVRQLQHAFVFEDNIEDQEWLQEEWMPAAQALFAATPVTVLEKLKTAEDEAVQAALKARQERAEAELQARLKAEAAAHQKAQELKAEQARQRLTRARLVAFYRKHAPEKEENIDKILVNYTDRLDVLDAKLFQKYGESFQPVLPKPKAPPVEPKKQSSVRQLPFGLMGQSRSTDNDLPDEDETEAEAEAATRKPDQVSVMVAAGEVLPIVCGGGARTGHSSAVRLSPDEEHPHPPLKYFLVDSRSEEAAAEQGRFPNVVTLSPESMLDPELVSQHEEKLENLRGSAHIVIMGEGFSAIPSLYKQKLSPTLEAAMVQDESRTSICALFFIKKGFPFVSVLDGGFAAAHSWLVREGPKHGLKASQVLTDYDPLASVFGQMETLHNASAAEKAQRQVANLLEKSLVAVTMQAQRFETMAAEAEANKQRSGGVGGGLRLGAFFKGAAQVGSSSNASRAKSPPQDEADRLRLDQDGGRNDEKLPSSPSSATTNVPQFLLRNPFARKSGDADELKLQPEDESSTADDLDTWTGTTTLTDEEGGRRSEETIQQKAPSPLNNRTNSGEETLSPHACSPKPLIGSVASSGVAGVSLSASNILKRNPFRAFGGGSSTATHGAGATSSPLKNIHTGGSKPVSQHARNKSAGGLGFASLNNLRKSALGRMRSDSNAHLPQQQEQQSSNAQSAAQEGEESISFN